MLNYSSSCRLEIEEKGGKNLDDMVLDLGADDRDGMVKQRSKLQWDRRKKKYVRTNASGTGGGGDINAVSMNQRKRLLNESGARIHPHATKDKAGGKRKYDQWSQRTRLRIPSAGEKELSLPPVAFRRRGISRAYLYTEHMHT